MKTNFDIYGYDKKIASDILRIKKARDISQKNKNAILKFYEQCCADGLSKARQEYYLDRLSRIARFIKKDFDKVTKQDILLLVKKINESSNYTENTKKDYKVSLKKFFRWFRKIEDKGVYPEEVRWINTNLKNNNHMLPEELLTEDEVKKLINTAEHPRDKALVATLYDSGCRIGELLSLKVKHLTFDKHSAILIVNGKTGMRRVRVIGATPYLASWKNVHPERNNPEAPLWVVIGTTKDIAKYKKKKYKFNWSFELRHRAATYLLKKLAKKADIKKRTNPHSFRHARATFLANKLTEAQLKELLGWTQSSKMAAVYVHISGRDTDKALLKVYGLEKVEEKEESKLKPKKCPRCEKENNATAEICEVCGAFLDMKTAFEIESKEKNFTHILKTLTQNQSKMFQVLKEVSGKKFDIALPSLEERQKISEEVSK